jgi:hypothetical protein
MPPPERTIDPLRQFIRAPTQEGSRRIVNANQELINVWIELIDTMLANPAMVPLIYLGSAPPDVNTILKKRRAVLVRCREIGVARTFSEMNPQKTGSRPDGKSHRGFLYIIGILVFAAAIAAGILIYNKAKPRVPKALIPQITRVATYRKGRLVYIRVHYGDPHHYATGFGFVGIDGAGWAEENHSFADPSYGIPGPHRIDYPFNLGCGTPSQDQSDVQFWITDVAGDRSRPVNVHLTCKHWTRVR